MPSIKIGDKVCEFEGKKTILQVALENDIEIPHYCYHPGMSIVASCRICLAEVAMPNPKTGELQTIPKLIPTCQQPAVDGAEVYINSEKTEANQKAVMEYLLVNHPLDCPVCDQAGECTLQDYSYRYGRAYSRFDETKVKNPKKDIGPHVLLYSDRCIMCSRCVRFTREVSGTSELCVSGRGNKEEIDIFPGKALDNELSGNVVDICPVGALLDKDFLFEQRVWYLKGAASIDGITASGDNILIEHNSGQIYRVKPRENLDVNQWWISDEIRYGWRHVHDPNRLTSPAITIAGKHSECDWNTAYTEVVNKFEAIVGKGQRLAAMISPMLSCEDAYALAAAVREFDAEAVLAIGPVPFDGEDKTFPGGYKISSEKAPNARGVRRVLSQLGGEVLEYGDLLNLLDQDPNGRNIGGLLLSGNYPSAWVTPRLSEVLADRFVVLVDTLPNMGSWTDVVLAGATWAEKDGSFQNVNDRLQSFHHAIAPIASNRAEAQIGLDLLAATKGTVASPYDVDKIRSELGDAFTADLHHPTTHKATEPDMAFAEF